MNLYRISFAEGDLQRAPHCFVQKRTIDQGQETKFPKSGSSVGLSKLLIFLHLNVKFGRRKRKHVLGSEFRLLKPLLGNEMRR